LPLAVPAHHPIPEGATDGFMQPAAPPRTPCGVPRPESSSRRAVGAAQGGEGRAVGLHEASVSSFRYGGERDGEAQRASRSQFREGVGPSLAKKVRKEHQGEVDRATKHAATRGQTTRASMSGNELDTGSTAKAHRDIAGRQPEDALWTTQQHPRVGHPATTARRPAEQYRSAPADSSVRLTAALRSGRRNGRRCRRSQATLSATSGPTTT